MTSPIVRIQWIETCQQNWVDLIFLHRIQDKPQYLEHPKWFINHMHRCIRDLGIWVVFLVTNLMGRILRVRLKLCLQTTWLTLVNIKIAGKWMFIPLKMVLIGIDPYPLFVTTVNVSWNGVFICIYGIWI
jgi:hypothetical protein